MATSPADPDFEDDGLAGGGPPDPADETAFDDAAPARGPPMYTVRRAGPRSPWNNPRRIGWVAVGIVACVAAAVVVLGQLAVLTPSTGGGNVNGPNAPLQTQNVTIVPSGTQWSVPAMGAENFTFSYDNTFELVGGFRSTAPVSVYVLDGADCGNYSGPPSLPTSPEFDLLNVTSGIVNPVIDPGTYCVALANYGGPGSTTITATTAWQLVLETT